MAITPGWRAHSVTHETPGEMADGPVERYWDGDHWTDRWRAEGDLGDGKLSPEPGRTALRRKRIADLSAVFFVLLLVAMYLFRTTDTSGHGSTDPIEDLFPQLSQGDVATMLAVDYYFELVETNQLNDPAACARGWERRLELFDEHYSDGSMDRYRDGWSGEREAFMSECTRDCLGRASFQGRNASCEAPWPPSPS